MKKWALLKLCIGLLEANLCLAQSNTTVAPNSLAPFDFSNGVQPKAPPGATNWGKSVAGVRLSITMANGFVEAGSTNIIVAVITNSSTNFIEMGVTSPAADFDPILTSSAGKLYHLVAPLPMPLLTRVNMFVAMHPGEQCVWILSVPFVKSIEPGNYTLQASRGFKTSDGGFKLESNPLKIQVK
jgi:hypothetical protein